MEKRTNRVPRICRAIVNLTDAEMEEMRAIARAQIYYSSPLKMATQSRQNALGQHNLEVVNKLEALRMVLAREV